MKSKHVEDIEIESDKIPHMMNLVTVKAMLEKMQISLTVDNAEPDSVFDRMCRQISKNVGTINDAIDIAGITDDIIKNQEWFIANRDYKKTKSGSKPVRVGDFTF